MNDPAKNPFQPFFDEIRRIVRDELKAQSNGTGDQPLLTPEELAQQLSVPVSWVYEQSRQEKSRYTRSAAISDSTSRRL